MKDTIRSRLSTRRDRIRKLKNGFSPMKHQDVEKSTISKTLQQENPIKCPPRPQSVNTSPTATSEPLKEPHSSSQEPLQAPPVAQESVETTIHSKGSVDPGGASPPKGSEINYGKTTIEPSGKTIEEEDILDRVFESVEATVCKGEEYTLRSPSNDPGPPAKYVQTHSLIEGKVDDRADEDVDFEREQGHETREPGEPEESDYYFTIQDESPKPKAQSSPAINPNGTIANKHILGKNQNMQVGGKQNEEKHFLDLVFENVEALICTENHGAADANRILEDLEVKSGASSPMKLHNLATLHQPDVLDYMFECGETSDMMQHVPMKALGQQDIDGVYDDIESGKLVEPKSAPNTEVVQEATRPKGRSWRNLASIEELLNAQPIEIFPPHDEESGARLDELRSKKRELELRLAVSKSSSGSGTSSVPQEKRRKLKTIQEIDPESKRRRWRTLVICIGIMLFSITLILLAINIFYDR